MDHSTSRKGLLYGCATFALWGVFPLYFKSLGDTPPLEILSHRIVWSFVLLAALVTARGRWRELYRGLQAGRAGISLLATTLLIAANWLLYIYSVSSGQVLQSSLGYFITPLANVLLGVLVLGERLRPWQTASVLLATGGVLGLTWLAGELPWLALSLAASFSLYGLLRKTIVLDGLLCLMVETLILAPLAAGYLLWLPLSGRECAFHGLGSGMSWLLIFSGPVTAVPLLFFAAAVRRLPLSTMGILQYLAPTLQFLLAVLAFGEPFSAGQFAAFCCIWTAVALYTADSLRHFQRSRATAVALALARAGSDGG